MGRKKKYQTEEERLAARKAQDAERYKQNKDKIRAQRAERYKQNRDEILAKMAEYYQQNRDKILARVAEYRQEHRDEIRAQDAKYRSTPKGRANNLVNNYRKEDRKCKRGECTITDDWIVNNVFSGQCCQYCGESDWTKLGVDRIDNNLPHTPENCVPCCGVCNVKRNTTEYDNFMRLIGKVK